MTKEAEPTNHQIFKAVQDLSVSVDKRFAIADSRSDEIMEAIHVFAESDDRRFDTVHADIRDMRGQIGGIRGQMTSLVTKDYLDDKLADLRGDLVVLTRRPDRKVDALVDVLREKRVINDADVQRVTTATR